MDRRIYRFLIIAIFAIMSIKACFANEVLPTMDSNKDVAVLNDELQRMRNQISTLSDASSVPSGVILLWSGAIEDIPDGWVLCNGENDTPDLTDRFVIHADADSGGTNNVGDTGGSRTISIDNMPEHSHDIDSLNVLYHGNNAGSNFYGWHPNFWSTISSMLRFGYNSNPQWEEFDVDSTTSNSGSNEDFLPKYYALAYIQKL